MTKKTNSTKSVSKKTQTKQALKAPKVNQRAVELGNLCVHALALFTNAVIKKRTENEVEMFIPLTLMVGKKTDILEITYKAVLSATGWEGCETMSLPELGKTLFTGLCNTVRESDALVGIVGKPFNALNKFEILTDYKDKCVYKDGTLTFVKAGQPKSKKK